MRSAATRAEVSRRTQRTEVGSDDDVFLLVYLRDCHALEAVSTPWPPRREAVHGPNHHGHCTRREWCALATHAHGSGAQDPQDQLSSLDR